MDGMTRRQIAGLHDAFQAQALLILLPIGTALLSMGVAAAAAWVHRMLYGETSDTKPESPV